MLFSARTCTLLLYWSRIFENIVGRTYRTFKCSDHSLQNVNLQDESIPIFYNKYRGEEAHATSWEQPAVCALNNRIHCGLWGLSLCTHCHEPICSNPCESGASSTPVELKTGNVQNWECGVLLLDCVPLHQNTWLHRQCLPAVHVACMCRTSDRQRV